MAYGLWGIRVVLNCRCWHECPTCSSVTNPVCASSTWLYCKGRLWHSSPSNMATSFMLRQQHTRTIWAVTRYPSPPSHTPGTHTHTHTVLMCSQPCGTLLKCSVLNREDFSMHYNALLLSLNSLTQRLTSSGHYGYCTALH